jgi:hypothetical protein
LPNAGYTAQISLEAQPFSSTPELSCSCYNFNHSGVNQLLNHRGLIS